MVRKSKQYKKRLAYNNEYNKKNYRSFSVRYGKESEKDIIEYLETKDSFKAFITQLIRQEMNSSSHQKDEPKNDDN